MYKALVVWGLLAFPLLGHGEEFDFKNYKPAELGKTVANIPSANEYGIVVAKDVLKFKSVVYFTGERRQASKETGEIIARWGKAHGEPPEFAQWFTHEVQVRDGNQTFWLPLEEDFLAEFDDEVPAGGKVEIYVMYLGVAGRDKVFVVDEFQSLALGGSTDPNHPVMGSWRYDYPSDHCAETHTFKPNAVEAFVSGNESGEIEFDIARTPTKAGYYLMRDTVVSHNGMKDCSGGETPVGFKSAIYLRIDQNKKELFMCGKQDLKACVGPFARVLSN